MSTYGITRYGTDKYGLTLPVTVIPGGSELPPVNNAYLIDPFTAMAVDYQNILLTWTAPVSGTSTPMTEFRLLSSRYGFPVDQNDGNILIDTTSNPGSHFVDQNVVPGSLTYYGFYINTGSSWVRSGFAACLMPANYDYASRLWSYLPVYLRDQANGDLTTDAAGDAYLAQFLQVAGFGMDYLKTQYDFLFNYQNDPMKMSFADLAQLSGQLGMPFSGEIPAYFLRKAADNWAVVMQQRGSLTGIAEHVSLLTGFGADIQLARNIMLENDQSMPKHPHNAPWSAGTPYAVGEMVSWPVYPSWVLGQAYVVNNYVVYNGVNYQCIATGGQGIPPAGATTSGTYWAVAAGPYVYKCTAAITSLPGIAPPGAGAAGSTPNGSNANWQLVYESPASSTPLAISGLVGGASTWEVLLGSSPASSVAATSLLEAQGMRNPANWTNDYAQNAFQVYNRTGSAQDIWFRSVSRGPADVTAGSQVPDPQLVIEHAIPVPQPGQPWNPSTRYATGTVVEHNGVNYLALRASTGATPPALGVPLNMNWDFETTVSPWTTQNGATVTQSNAEAYHGTNSMKMTFVSGDDGQTYATALSEDVACIPGATYSGTAWAYSPAGWSAVAVTINWSDVFGNYLSTGSGSSSALTAAQWAQVTSGPQTAPNNAATMNLVLVAQNTPTASTIIYWDLATVTCTATPEWLPLSADSRIPLVISAETAQDWSVAAVEQFQIYPFAEFYDNWGNLITRAFARTPTAGTAGTPSSYVFDSFTTGPGTSLKGRAPDAGSAPWNVLEGSWVLDGNGNVYPTPAGTYTIGVVPAPLSATQAVTFTESPQSGTDAGLIFWYSETSASFWHAGTKGLYYNNGSWTEVAVYPTAGQFAPGDRIYVVTNQAATGSTVAVSVYRNLVQAYSSATGNGLVATVTATAAPSGSVPGSGATVYSGIASEAV